MEATIEKVINTAATIQNILDWATEQKIPAYVTDKFEHEFMQKENWEFILTRTARLCQVEIVKEQISPSGNSKAVLFQFDCGATTPFTSNVSILKTNEVVKYKSGNVFSCYGGNQRGSWGGPLADFTWTGNDELLISYATDANVTKTNSRNRSVKIKYNTLPRTGDISK